MELVRSLKLFCSMDDQHFAELMQASYLQTFPAHLDLIFEAEPADFLYVVLEGEVELYGTSNGRTVTLGTVLPVETFILAAVLRDSVYLMSARTCERSRLLLISSQNVRDAFGKDHAFASAVIDELAGRYRSVVRELKNMKLRTGLERLANVLLTFNERQGGGGNITLPYDKKFLASSLGLTPEYLSRAFSTLKEYGVEVNGPEIKLKDLKALLNLAKPNPLIERRKL